MSLLASVLLVDDDATAAYLHQFLLTRMQVADHVLLAEDGQQALDLLAAPGTVLPALILLDLNMPVLNGWEFLARFAALPLPAPRPLVVVLSSASQTMERVRIEGLPVTAFLEKPLTREKITALLQAHFGG